MASSKSTDRRRSPFETLREVIGEDLALKVAMSFGGQRVYIPNAPPRDSELVAVIGEIAARALAARMGGLYVSVPLRIAQNAKIVELRKKRKSIAQIRRAVGCSERKVFRVLADYKAGGGTLPSGDECGDRRPHKNRRKRKGGPAAAKPARPVVQWPRRRPRDADHPGQFRLFGEGAN